MLPGVRRFVSAADGAGEFEQTPKALNGDRNRASAGPKQLRAVACRPQSVRG